MSPPLTARKKRPLAARARSEAGGPPAAAGFARISPLRLPRRLSPRKSPAQARARETVEAILEAAVDLFSSKGYARTSMHLAARAGSLGRLPLPVLPEQGRDPDHPPRTPPRGGARHRQRRAPRPRHPAVPLRTGVRRLLKGFRALHDADPRLARAVEQQAGQMPSVPRGSPRTGTVPSTGSPRSSASRPDVRAGNHALMAALLGEMARP